MDTDVKVISTQFQNVVINESNSQPVVQISTDNNNENEKRTEKNITKAIQRKPTFKLLSRSKRKLYNKNNPKIDVFHWNKNSVRNKTPAIEKVHTDNADFINKLQSYTVSLEIKEKWCEPIYINSNCCAGPFIVNDNLKYLPKFIGPGPLSIVIQFTLNRLLYSAYYPLKVMNRWIYRGSLENSDTHKFIDVKLTAFDKTFIGRVRSIFHPEDLADFCKELCSKIDACPNLFGTEQISQCSICLNGNKPTSDGFNVDNNFSESIII